MRIRSIGRIGAVAAALTLGIGLFTSSGAGAAGPGGPGLFGSGPLGLFHLPFAGTPRNVCATPTPGHVSCLAQVLAVDDQPPTATPSFLTTPSGLSPSTMDAVYGFSSATSGGAGKTIAVVDAYDDPDAASDLASFSSTYGLPAPNLEKVNESGGTTYPASNSGWDLEISLDIEWVHAVAPGATILLVEANSNSLTDLVAAEQYAGQHAGYVTNSWSSGEFSSEGFYDQYFDQPGTSYFAATGDSGGAVGWPATSPDVIAVGGTSLKFTNSNQLAAETAWSDGGGGCSSVENAPNAQSSFVTYAQAGCSGRRATPDVSLDADPNSGVAVLDSVPYEGSSGWWTVGGTSLSTPMFAAESAVLGSQVSSSTVYSSSSPIPFRDIVSGNNSHPALVGFDLATGRGSWAYTPGIPTSLGASATSGGIALQWTAPSPGGEAPSSYQVFRGTSSGGETVLATGLSPSTTTYTDSSVSSGTGYYYEVVAIDSFGNGPFSNEATATAGSGGGGGGGSKPGAPTSLKGSVSGSTVSLTWTAPSGTVSSYTVLRGSTSGGETTLASTGSTSYQDSSTSACAPTCYYEVEAVNGNGTGPVSNQVSEPIPTGGGGPPPPPPPPPPGNGPTVTIAKSCSNYTCTFTANTTGSVVKWAWSASNSASGSSSTFVDNLLLIGSYSVSVTVTDSSNRTAKATVTGSCGYSYTKGTIVCT